MITRLIALILFCSVCGSSGNSNAETIADIINKAGREGKVVMLELGSVGCLPCEQMKPVMKKLSENYKGQLEVLFIDVKKDRDTAKRFRVFAIPTQVFLDKNGKEFHRHMGYYSYEEIVTILKKSGL